MPDQLEETSSNPSTDRLGKRDDDPFGASDIGHPPRALVLADSAHQLVAGGPRAVDGGVQVMDLESNASPSASLAIAAGEPARSQAG
jgi:hypothetical protein